MTKIEMPAAADIERAACMAVLQACHDRLLRQAQLDDNDVLRLEARRIGEAIDGVRQGLHIGVEQHGG